MKEGMTKKEGFSKKEIGALGERLAAEFLTRQGYKILDRNFFCRVGEIDIVAAAPDGAIVFVEVKTRCGQMFGRGDEAVSPQKLRKMKIAATVFLQASGPSSSSGLRFDVISCSMDMISRRAQIRHFENVGFGA